MNKNKKKKNQARNRQLRAYKPPAKQTFAEHLQELRRRLFLIAASVLVWSGLAYAVQRQIVALLLKPSHGEKFVYTSPIGGVDFLFRVCLYSGIIVSIPVIVYQFLRYIEPLMAKDSARFIAFGSLTSGILALAGIAFGYFLGLPAALHFLLHQFITNQVTALLTIQSYMSFVMVYMVGSALLFQLPLIILFINRIKPLKPQQLWKAERWVILLAFVMAGLMNPTPHLLDQLVVAGPIIIMYHLSILMIALINRGYRRPKYIDDMLQQDAAAQATRQQRLASMQIAWQEASAMADQNYIAARSASTVTPVKPLQPAPRLRQLPTRSSGKYLDGFVTRQVRRNSY